jgi:hypothetical protein
MIGAKYALPIGQQRPEQVQCTGQISALSGEPCDMSPDPERIGMIGSERPLQIGSK